MTTRFDNQDALVEFMTGFDDLDGIPKPEIKQAIDSGQSITIGFPQNQAATRFEIGGHAWAVSEFRDGVCLWYHNQRVDMYTRF